MEKELILEIIKKALEINSRQRNTIFINYYGHVNSISIQLHTNGWNQYEKADYSKDIYMENNSHEQNEKELKEILEKLKELSITNQSHDSSND